MINVLPGIRDAMVTKHTVFPAPVNRWFSVDFTPRSIADRLWATSSS